MTKPTNKPYQKRYLLKNIEKEAIAHYKDLETKPYEWDYRNAHPEEKKSKSLGWDCFMINNYMRHSLKHHLSSHDIKLIIQTICRITRAIYKSKVTESIDLFRGIKYKYIADAVEAWENGKIGEIHEWAFESFSQSKIKAINYAIMKDPKCPILMHLVLEPGEEGLYIDDVEEERLLPPETTYRIIDVNEFEYIGDDENTDEKISYLGKIYTVKKLK